MKKRLTDILLAIVLLSVLFSIEQSQLAHANAQQPNCVDQTIRDVEILTHKRLDINQDGIEDDIIIYLRDDELYILVAISEPTSGCKIVLNDYLVHSGGRTVMVQRVELVDLTGDDQPDLHIWLDLSIPTFRGSYAFHTLYMLRDGTLKQIFVLSQCLQTSSFEFRTAPDGAKLIYLDEDRLCAPPSFRRDYEILRWDAKISQFESIESGQIAKTSPDPLLDSLISIYIIPIVTIVAGAIVIGVVAWRASKRKSAKAKGN